VKPVIRLALGLLVALGLAGCSVRSVVVPPEQLPALNDSKWTVESDPR
jgi:hypothetical protein